MPNSHSKLSQQTRQRLENELIRANAANASYNSFVKEFLEVKRNILINEFLNTEPENTDRMSEIRRMIIAIEALDADFQSEISTGELAKKQLAEAQND